MDIRILVCDDEEGMRRYLEKMLQKWGYRVETFECPHALLKRVEDLENPADLLLLDVKMPEMDGIDVLRQTQKLRPTLPVIMMTGHGTIETAVDAMKIGAWDYLTKPFPMEKLSALVRHALEQEQLRTENTVLKKELQERSPTTQPVFRSEKFHEVFELALAVADSDSSVLILGESGTGKELIARSIHQSSPRAARPMLAINCAALSETLLESQLFGHVKGAFTGAGQTQKGLLEEAHESTLFLDEVGDLSPSLQAKLLRVLQEGEFIPVGSTKTRRVDVRFVSATNKDLKTETTKGTFREDLYYRLNVFTLELPPLRERPEDIEPLVRHFLEKIAKRSNRTISGIDPAALRALQTYPWPGNVRELENVIERCAILARGGQLSLQLLPFKDSPPAPRADAPEAPPLSFRDAEYIQLLKALTHTDWNKSQAALLLGTTRKTLDRKIREFNLSPKDMKIK